MKRFGLLFVLAIIAVTLCVPLSVSAEEEKANLSSFKDVYVMDTGIVNPPSVIAEITDKTKYDALTTEKTPALAVYYVNDELSVVDETGTYICDLYTAISSNKRIIPAVYVKNQAQADAYINFIKEYGLVDAFVISDDADLVLRVRKQCRGVLGAVDFSNTSVSETIDYREISSKSFAHIAILSASQATAETLEYLTLRQQNVWVKTNGSNLEAFEGARRGAVGIITNSPSSTIELFESFSETTMFRRPLVIGHTGDRGHSENTIASALSAIEKGADGVECDIQLTKDNKVVLMHDTTIDRTTNGTGAVSSMTLEELQQYTVINSNEKIPSFDDYLAALKGKNCIIYVEFKYSVTALIPYVKELIKKHDIEDQIAFITFHEPVVAALRQQYPEIPVSYLGSDVVPATAYANTGVYNCAISPNYVSTTAEKTFFLHVRGINVNSYTYTSANAFNDKYLENHASLTTDIPSLAVDYEIKAASILDEYYIYTTSDRAYSLIGSTVNRLGDEIGTTKGFIVIESNTELITDPIMGTYGTSDGYAYISYYGTCDKLNYTVYSDPIPVIVGNGKLPDRTPSINTTPGNTPSIDKKGCGAVSATTTVLPILFVTAILLKKKYTV